MELTHGRGVALLSSLLAPVHVEGCLCSVVTVLPPLELTAGIIALAFGAGVIIELDDRHLSQIAGILVRRGCAHAQAPGRRIFRSRVRSQICEAASPRRHPERGALHLGHPARPAWKQGGDPGKDEDVSSRPRSSRTRCAVPHSDAVLGHMFEALKNLEDLHGKEI